MTQMLTLALSKGRIFEETMPLLQAAGVVVSEDPEKSRKLILPTSDPLVRVVIVRASDTPTYVQYGAADLGIAGKDVLFEHGGDGLYQPVDLRIGREFKFNERMRFSLIGEAFNLFNFTNVYTVNTQEFLKLLWGIRDRLKRLRDDIFFTERRNSRDTRNFTLQFVACIARHARGTK